MHRPGVMSYMRPYARVPSIPHIMRSIVNDTPAMGAQRATFAWIVLFCGVISMALFVIANETLKIALYVIVVCVSVISTVVGTLRHQPREQRLPWWALLGAEAGFFCIVMISPLLPETGETPSGEESLIYSILNLPLYLLMAYILVILLRQRRIDNDDPARADILLVGLATTLVGWTFLIEPKMNTSGSISLSDLVTSTFPIIDMVVLVISIRLLLIKTSRTPALWLLGSAVCATYSGDLVLVMWGASAPESLSLGMEILVLGGYIAVGAAAVHPTIRLRAEPQPVILRSLGLARTLWITAALMTPVAISIMFPPPNSRAGMVRMTLSTLITVTVIGRLVRNTNFRIQAERDARHQANHDHLTGLPNRTQLSKVLDREITPAQEITAVLLLDLDGFKNINDTYGHDVGDAVLITFADILQSRIRTVDTIARLGGDEFVIVLTGTSSPRDAIMLAEHILRTVAKPVTIQGHSITIASSIGIAIANPENTHRADELLRCADRAMYEAKRTKGNGWRLYNDQESGILS